MKTQFSKRLMSFVWRLGSYLVVASIAWIGDNIGLMELPELMVVIVALTSGEITKYLNKPKTDQ